MSFTFPVDETHMPPVKQRHRKNIKMIDANVKGYYLGLRGFISKDGRGRWAWKIGQGIGVKGILGRCDAQSLSLAFGWPNGNIGFGECWLLDRAEAYVGSVFQTEKAHTFAGSTETFGNWAEPFDAYQEALDFVEWISAEDGAPEATNFWSLVETPAAY
jgi:hypothetical protein